MIHEIGRELDAHLRARGCPVRVFDTESTTTTTFGRERIVLERDEAGDRFGNVHGQRSNGKHVMTRSIGCKLTIYAQATGAGTSRFEHERRADRILDHVLVCLVTIGKLRHVVDDIRPSGGRFVLPDDLAKSEAPGGAVYELRFTFDRAIEDRTWANELGPEATLGGEGGITISSMTRARLAHGPADAEPETGCGG